MLGFAAWLSGEGALAWCAVERCLEGDPGDALAHNVAALLQNAVPPSTLDPDVAVADSGTLRLVGARLMIPASAPTSLQPMTATKVRKGVRGPPGRPPPSAVAGGVSLASIARDTASWPTRWASSVPTHGQSGGGPFSLACAAVLGDRVTGAGDRWARRPGGARLLDVLPTTGRPWRCCPTRRPRPVVRRRLRSPSASSGMPRRRSAGFRHRAVATAVLERPELASALAERCGLVPAPAARAGTRGLVARGAPPRRDPQPSSSGRRRDRSRPRSTRVAHSTCPRPPSSCARRRPQERHGARERDAGDLTGETHGESG